MLCTKKDLREKPLAFKELLKCDYPVSEGFAVPRLDRVLPRLQLLTSSDTEASTPNHFGLCWRNHYLQALIQVLDGVHEQNDFISPAANYSERCVLAWCYNFHAVDCVKLDLRKLLAQRCRVDTPVGFRRVFFVLLAQLQNVTILQLQSDKYILLAVVEVLRQRQGH